MVNIPLSLQNLPGERAEPRLRGPLPHSWDTQPNHKGWASRKQQVFGSSFSTRSSSPGICEISFQPSTKGSQCVATVRFHPRCVSKHFHIPTPVLPLLRDTLHDAHRNKCRLKHGARTTSGPTGSQTPDRFLSREGRGRFLLDVRGNNTRQQRSSPKEKGPQFTKDEACASETSQDDREGKRIPGGHPPLPSKTAQGALLANHKFLGSCFTAQKAKNHCSVHFLPFPKLN